jgi:4-amino-4-deoxy-L-arabinose transferase-like glycosyltransferase
VSHPARHDDGQAISGVWVGRHARGQPGVWPARGLALVAAITLVAGTAVMLRWPYLWHWPAFTDETREVLLALSVARGEQLVWTNVNTYMGPLHVYLTAAALALTGGSVLTPRLLVLAMNLLAVACTGLLAARLGGRFTGLVASLLAAIAPMWIINNSHVAWSANTTPTYVMAALLCAQIALGRAAPPAAGRGDGPVDAAGPLPRLSARRGAWLVAAGVLVGLAGQTHPTGWFAAGGIALATVWGRDGWQRLASPWPWAALGAMVATYTPVLIHAFVIAPERTAAEVASSAAVAAWAKASCRSWRAPRGCGGTRRRSPPAWPSRRHSPCGACRSWWRRHC